MSDVDESSWSDLPTRDFVRYMKIRKRLRQINKLKVLINKKNINDKEKNTISRS